MSTQNTPTLSGAQFGRVQCWREIPGGIWLDIKDQGLHNRPAAVRFVSRKVSANCMDYARQYLQGRADKMMMGAQLDEQRAFFLMHYALVEVPRDAESKPAQMFAVPPTLVDAAGKISAAIVPTLALNDLVAGQLERITREYELLHATETPDRSLTSQEWETIVAEGKEQPLKTLHSRHGSSRLIQVLHGLRDGVWPE